MYRIFKYCSIENGCDIPFSDGFQVGVALCFTVFLAYNLKLRNYMPWNRK